MDVNLHVNKRNLDRGEHSRVGQFFLIRCAMFITWYCTDNLSGLGTENDGLFILLWTHCVHGSSSMFFYENAFVLDCFSIYFDVVGDGLRVKCIVLIF